MRGSMAGRAPSSASITAPTGAMRKISVADMWKSGRSSEIDFRTTRAFAEANLIVKEEKLKKSGARYRIRLGAEVLVVAAILLLTWSVLSLPVVFYFTDPDEVSLYSL